MIAKQTRTVSKIIQGNPVPHN